MVEFRTEELMKKAVDKVNKHNMNGRPLKVKEVILEVLFMNNTYCSTSFIIPLMMLANCCC